MGGHRQLRDEPNGFDREDVQDLPNKHLLQLRMQVSLRFFDHNQMNGRAVLLFGGPPLMEIQHLNDHVNEVLKPQSIVLVWQGQSDFAGGFPWVLHSIMNARIFRE
jgi:hypothetical protein